MNRKYIPLVVLAFLFSATALSFLDRQVLSMTIIKIQQEFKVTDFQYGIVNTSFLISYALMFTIGGRLMDKFGSKKGLAVSVGVWSIANSLHGIISNFYHLVIFRFLLGAGEGGCFPGAAKAVFEWFNEKNRGLANGIAIGGAAIGAVIAPPLTIFISSKLGWRSSFVIPGLIGIVWVVGWLLIPSAKKRVQNQNNEALVAKSAIPFSTILKNKQAQTFILIRFLLDPVLYFIMFWTPKYLNEQRNISFENIGSLFWIPFLALGVSNIVGGFFSDKLVKKGVSINRARKTVMGIAAALTLVAPMIAFVSSAQVAVALMAVIMFAHGFWITNYITSISDIFGGIGTSTVVGLSGTAGAISGLIINPLIGLVIQSYSYSPIWIACGLMYPLAFVLFIVFIPKIQLVRLQTM
ncbi:MFS transporter [Segetibacter sp.]|jgi:ACS family hexuronate transporter-like MFS transporter|uniref:MFS transporter n=1 Tax=Segetibacter sp. TaxID=2231182 RepID=UPI002625980A|nr:MFS transporter [Segetibacter sp.]MCW3079700.1 major facilitator superfamily protein [Segetibacter sp.]